MYRGKSKRIRGKHISGGPAVCVCRRVFVCRMSIFHTYTHAYKGSELAIFPSFSNFTKIINLRFTSNPLLSYPPPFLFIFFNLYLFPLSSQPLHILSFLPSSTPSFNLLSYNLHVAFLHPILVSHPRILSSTFLSYLLFFTLSFLVLNLPQPLPFPLPFSLIKYYVAFSFIFPHNIAQNISLSSTSSTSLLPPLCPPLHFSYLRPFPRSLFSFPPHYPILVTFSLTFHLPNTPFTC